MKGRFHFFKLIVFLFFTGISAASAQDFFRVIGGIPHFPSVDPTTVLSPVQGMLIYSTKDQQPMIYGGSSWETLCSSNVSTQTVKDYFEVKTGIPYLSALTDKPAGTIPSGGIYFSKTEHTMMVYNGNEWTSVAKLYGKGSFTTNTDFSTNSGLQISRLPVLSNNPIPLGLSAGAIYLNSVSKVIRYYNGVAWKDISCLPVISTIPPTKITNTSAQSGADIKSNGGSAVTVQGICWGTSPNPDITLSTKTEQQIFGSDIGLFPGIVSGLKANTVYHVRAYAINDSGIVYGEDLTFTSALASKPTIITLDISDFTPVSANSGGNITSDGGAPITARGITWSVKGDPINDPDALITSDGSGVGIFPSKLINLLRNTTYYVRAYAVNVMGKEYGNLIEFTTPSATAPVLSSPNIRIVDITDESAVSEVTIINNGGEMVTERGMSWSTDRVNITYGPSTQVNATDIGTFVCNITNLQPGTLYYVRAYAKNIIGTSYSSESSFITTSLPTLTTLEPYNYDAASHRDGWFSGYNGTIALSGGDITSNGVSLITKRGICWSTNPNPTTDLTTKTELNVTGSGTGTFYSYLTSLIPGTTYYVRAYAINSMGTAYGDEMTFKTPQIPDLITKPATDITSMSLSSGGDIVDNGRMPIVTQGLCWNTTNNPDIEGPHTSNGTTGQGFISLLKNLMGNTTYYIRAYATNYVGTNYGEVLEVTTTAPIKPVVVTAEVPGTAGSATTGGGDVTSNGGADITSRGVVWSLTSNFTPDLSTSNKSQVAGATGRFNSPITGLSPNKTYYVRAYAVNSAGVAFGNEVTFKTFTIPSLTTTPVSNITGYGAISGGDIFSDGGDKVTTSGIVWGTAPNPTTDLLTKTRGGTGIGSFIHNIIGLLGSTTYYVRAYATNSAGTAYGNEYSFTTSPPVLPEIETVEATEITGGSALSGGLLITNGGALLSKSGIIWDTVSGFVPNQSSVNKTVQYGQGNFASAITDLTPGTTYYVRAYAQNSVGLVYGKEIVFKTASLAVLTTLVPIPSSITSISATSGGSIINNGGSYIRSNGVCWSTSENPTLADKNVVSGSGSGNFTSNITDLLGATRYYVRAFASNFAGVAYGQQESFTTAPPVPSTILTLKVTDLTGTTANSGGDITSNGGALISTRGLVWSTNQGFDPATVTSNKTAETGYEKGIFYSQMKGLTPGTTYYVRAYAVSIAGTSYGEERSFTTPNMATIVTNSPGLITNTTAVMGGTVTDSGGSPIIARGVLWSTIDNFDPNSTIIDKTSNGTGMGSFSTTLKDLIPDTRYYVRAYAVTIAGTSYGQQVGFTTYSPTLPVLTTVVPNRITGIIAYSGGNIEDEGGVTAVTRGVYFSTVPNFSLTASSTKQTIQSGSGKGVFPSLMQGLTPGTTYYVRAYASNRVGTAYGEELSFTTQTTPTLTTINITGNTGITAMSGGVISSNGDAPIHTQGVCWSTNPNPTIGLATKTNDAGGGVFTSKLTSLKPVTKYYVRAYATNDIGTSYGNEISFTTTPIVATLTTSDAVITSNTTASAGGTISNDGGAAITERGIVFSRKANFNPAVDAVVRTSDGQGIGTFISELYDLEKSRTYYFRAYAVNSAGTAYGNQLTIAIFASSPILTTNKVTEVAGTTATSGGEIESDGGAEVTRRGIVWSKQQNPTITLPTRTSDVDLGDGKFTSYMTGLEPNTTYYVRAYAINGIGVAYGLQESFITLALPTLTATDPVTNIRATTATSGGEITDDGRTPILSRGIVWDTYSNPDIYRLGTKTVDNVTQGIGHFTADMTGLLPNTTYYVRAYATNKVGVNYGSEVRFKTNVVTVPVLTTSAVTDVEGYSAKGGGHVIDDGGMPVVTRGVVWSTQSQPTIALPTKIVNGTAGLGVFENVFAGLIPGTTYYMRAFATNSKGTGYGEEVTFSSSSVVPSVSNVTISNAKLNTADGKAMLIFDGGSVITDLGLAWNTVDTIPVAPANHISVGSMGTDILSTITGLLPATKYYVWAYGTNAIGSGYSLKSVTFSTPDLPKIITTKITAIAQSTASSGGSGITDGGIPITVKGICWSTAENPTVDLSTKTEQGTGVAAFASNMTGLTKGTTYYVRAYATNAMGTSYGNQETFKTIDIPALKTVVATDILSISANSGGEVITDGGAVITVKGVVWDTKENPEITLSTKTSNGTGIANYISKMAPLTKSTKYYYRAYATNSIGTAYGQQEELTTLAELPVVSIVTMSEMTQVSAKGTAEITSDGGAEVTTRGLVWNTTGNPTIDNGTLIPNGAGPGIFNNIIDGLEEGPTYYVRAYATNEIGTAYSATVTSFKICPATFIVSHVQGLNGAAVTKTVTYGTVSSNISGEARCWITQNLGADRQAASALETDEASVGWYWQFNKLQGYAMSGTTRTPNTAWIPAISENSNWIAGNDPCIQLLGTGWRLPTYTEWNNVRLGTQMWKNAAEAYSSVLKLHTSALLNYSSGAAERVGTEAYFWASTSDGGTRGWTTYFTKSGATVAGIEKSYGASVRCLRDSMVISVPSVSKVTISDMTAVKASGTATVTPDGGAAVTARGLVWNTTGNPTLADNVLDNGSGIGTFSNTLEGLKEGPTYYVRGFATNKIGTGYSPVETSFKICPPTLTVSHIAGLNGAPVTKTVTYKTVSTNISGAARCWITQNLGADQEATSANDATEAASGWYWQFNKLQGYKMEGTTRTPGTAWISSISENSNWVPANDPCVQLLSGGWRMPTTTEWTNAKGAPQNWINNKDAYNSVLKLHAAGFFSYTSEFVRRGLEGYFWSSTQASSGNGGVLYFTNAGGAMTSFEKAYGWSVRCLRDEIVKTTPSVSDVIVPAATMKDTSAEGTAMVTPDGGAAVTAKGLVWNTTGNPTLADNVVPSGAGIGAIAGTLTGLEEGPTYYVRAFATNSEGTSYSVATTSFKICKSFTVIHKAGLNGAPATKTVTYGSINTMYAGAAKCWITQNLGADKQAAAVNDATEAAGGWYWQYNRIQGYKHDGTTRTPNDAWNPWTSISENLNWLPVNDPCTQLLGGGWRIPTTTEWNKAAAAPQSWTTPALAYASDLKLHAAGYLSGGNLTSRGAYNGYWTSDQYTSTNGGLMYNGTGVSYTDKSNGFPLRCLRDAVVKNVPAVSNVSVPVSGMTVAAAEGSATVTYDGGAAVIARGLVWNTTGDPTINDQMINLGIGTGDFSGQMTGLVEGPTYYVRAFATNGQGTGYSPTVTSFKICNPFTMIHEAGLNGAPVTKTVTYKTVSSSVSGAPRCWITQNLGADKQATAVNDATEPAAGWYWQFNKSQGYKHDGTDRKPNDAWTPWIGSISENANWLPANDPCVLLLGGGWRMPTSTEWTTVAAPPQFWKSPANAYDSELKLHSAGYLSTAGNLTTRGTYHGYWASTQYTSTYGMLMYNGSGVSWVEKANAFPVRCLRDSMVKNMPSVSNVTVLVADMTVSTAKGTAIVSNDGGTKVTARGLVWNTTGTPTLSDQVINTGDGTGSISGILEQLVEGPTYYVRAFATNNQGTAYSAVVTSFKMCNPFTVLHKAGLNGAPVDKTVTYKTVSSNVSGAARCWITQNLGADQQPTIVSDATEASGGWYWQFNKSQGYKHDGTVRTPNDAWTPWIGSISENSNWLAENDPCTQLLGGGWRMPTSVEWAAVAAPPQFWKTPAAAYASELKLHSAGYLSTAGGLTNRGSYQAYWASTSYTATNGMFMYNGSGPTYIDKANALPIRCLRDTIVKRMPSISNVIVPVAGMTANSADGSATVTNDGGVEVIARGLVWNTTGVPTLADNVIPIGKGTGDLKGTLANLVEGPTYYVRAYATNSEGTAYSALVTSFKICNPFTVIHKGGLNGAPVDKTVTYKTVSSNVSGAARCWITQNLGADKQAETVSEGTEAASGWYWQFNKLQGFKFDGTTTTTRLPNDAWTTWITANSENSSWDAANDPCTQLLGGGWRIPTTTEWTKVAAPPQNWSTVAHAYASELKIHSAGYISTAGALNLRGGHTAYWSSTQYSNASYGWYLVNGGTISYTDKATALPLRCLRDVIVKKAPSVTNVAAPVAEMTANSADGSATITNDGGAEVTARGLVWNTTGTPTLNDEVIQIGKGTGDIKATLKNLIEGPTYYVRAFATNSEGTTYSAVVTSFKICNPFTIIHKAGLNGAPVDKTVIYKTVSSNISGASRCWITQNLGADQQATAVGDASEAASGWYWQFNKKQGFKHDGTVRTPNDAWTPWIGANSENANWDVKNDPCLLLLGGGWRIPTSTEWTKAAAPPQYWLNPTHAYASELKLHMAGYLSTAGVSTMRGSHSAYWSSTQYSNSSYGWYLVNGGTMSYTDKATALPLRCLRDDIQKTIPEVSNVELPTAKMTATTVEATATVALNGNTPVTARGFVWNTSGSPTLSDQKLSLATGTGIITGVLTGLTEGPSYYVRAYATNSEGTAYSPVESSFKICRPLTISHTQAVNGAPVSKAVTYGTVSSSISGAAKCWITQNLGASQQAAAVNDDTEAAGGWYFQFNRSQGYKFDTGLRTPDQAQKPFPGANAENSNWIAANDPCTLLLGAGWRIPTSAEWTKAAAPPQYWLNPANSYASELKLHMAGYLSTAGALNSRGSHSAYYTSTQYSNTSYGWYLINGATISYVDKAMALPVRCLKD